MTQVLARDYTYVSALSLPRVDWDGLFTCEGPSVYVEQPGTERAYGRRPAEFVDDPYRTGIIPAAYLQGAPITYPPVFATAVPDAALVGFRHVLSPEGIVTDDYGFASPAAAEAYLAGRRKDVGPDAFLTYDAERGAFVAGELGRRTYEIGGDLVVLTSSEASNFGSFVFRVLPKLLLLREVHRPVSILVYAREDTFRQFLELGGLPAERIILHDPRCIYRADRIISFSNRNMSAFLDDESRRFLRGFAGKAGEAPGSSRIYVSRHSPGSPQKRRMRNEAELISALTARGFAIIEPQRLGAIEQIAAFDRAGLIVGPSGSGMFNAAFARDGARLIDIESEPHWIYAHAGLFSSCGLDYGIVVGRADDGDWSRHHKDWTVEIDALLARIDAFGR